MALPNKPLGELKAVRDPEVDEREVDILIVGGGMAACGTAFEVKKWLKDDQTVLLCDKAAMERSGAVAQGLSAINTYIGDNSPDDYVRMVRNDLMGVPGDEDGGGMSAFVVFSQLGFYPVTPGHPSYVLGSPLFKKVTISLSNGNNLVVEAPDNSEENVYVEMVELNDSRHEQNWISHEQIMNGGKLTFYMDNKAERKRGTSNEDLPFSLSRETIE